MTTLLTIIIMLASTLLVLLVYVQNPKGGGLSSDFGSAQQLGGVKRTTDFVEKATWTLAGVIAVLSIGLTIMSKTPAPGPSKQDANQEQQQQQQQGEGGQQQNNGGNPTE